MFSEMSVRENLEMGAFLSSDHSEVESRFDYVYSLFPILSDRGNQIANTLSGGEQQMLAIGRALMSAPKLLMFDEPSLGLAPKLVETVLGMVTRINRDLSISILLVEQNVQRSCEISNRAFVIENGSIVLQGDSADVLQNDGVRKAYLGL